MNRSDRIRFVGLICLDWIQKSSIYIILSKIRKAQTRFNWVWSTFHWATFLIKRNGLRRVFGPNHWVICGPFKYLGPMRNVCFYIEYGMKMLLGIKSNIDVKKQFLFFNDEYDLNLTFSINFFLQITE